MNEDRSAFQIATASDRLRKGQVTKVEDDASVSVAIGADGFILCCDRLHTGAKDLLTLARGDTVLVWVPDLPDDRGVVVGRVGESHAPAGTCPDEVVIEAKEGMTIRCGDGSIQLRKDGKILIKGNDLVSHARRLNRVKGGSVAIN